MRDSNALRVGRDISLQGEDILEKMDVAAMTMQRENSTFGDRV
jgi:hypothetical protein